MLNVNRLRYHYQNVLRQDLLLKCAHSNIMETPELRKVMIVAQVPYESVKQKRLALEILCGQKAVHFGATKGFFGRKMRQSSISGTSKGTQYSSFNFQKGLRQRGVLFYGKTGRLSTPAFGPASPKYYVRVCLRDESLYNFIEKLVTVICFQDFPIKIKGNIIELTIASNILRLFPEIQNHFDLFSVHNLEIMILTSAKNQEETRLVWTGLFQKEI